MNNLKLLVSMIAVAILNVGCSTATTPHADTYFGEASLNLKAKQLRDPAASVRNENKTVDGIEGQAASNAVDQYYKSFTKPAPPMTIINMGVLGSGQ